MGKSSVTTQLALSLCLAGRSVAVLDIDLTGPNIPHMFRVGDKTLPPADANGFLVPIKVHDADPTKGLGSLRIMSLGFLIAPGDAVVWRGPMKQGWVERFMTAVAWGETDYLLIDTPPGTSDENMTAVQTLLQGARPEQLAGAVTVTTPQAVATSDVRKQLDFCKTAGIRVIGIVENMSGFVCPKCAECSYIFSKGGGQVLAQDFGVKFLGSVPIDPQFSIMIAKGKRPVYPKGTVVSGQDMTAAGRGAGPQNQGDESDEPLVDIYRHCSLCPIYKSMAETVVRIVET